MCFDFRHVYVRFFSKGSLVETLMMKALVPAMMHAVDVYNSFTFFVQAQLVSSQGMQTIEGNHVLHGFVIRQWAPGMTKVNCFKKPELSVCLLI